jgi:hypothetical protein
MARCDTCGNEYPKAFQVVVDGQAHTFDCFEWAIQALAPRCHHCGGAVIGHGVERNQRIFCCEHCARHEAPPRETVTLAPAGANQL